MWVKFTIQIANNCYHTLQNSLDIAKNYNQYEKEFSIESSIIHLTYLIRPIPDALRNIFCF